MYDWKLLLNLAHTYDNRTNHKQEILIFMMKLFGSQRLVFPIAVDRVTTKSYAHLLTDRLTSN